ncbi:MULTISPECIES: peptidase E [Ramlibacter]|uniref:Peptidase E n=1 Tax=Ramlibacter aquaticus TaxID=2780094 RepID=A0ABR9S9R2_9BURK|nr:MULTISPECIES: peptidase E [Ramlibacter]MBE7939035.1 peptidase E [Ramlibacter aquaticus]
MTRTPRILAIGGGGFLMEGRFSSIDRELLRLTGRDRPRVCLIPTPAGDAEELIQRFHAAYGERCEAWQLTPFRKPGPRALGLRSFADELLGFDAVFVSGGNTRSALGVWREWGIDEALRAAHRAGVLLAGMSAGALCWFEAGFTDSFGDGYAPLQGLGVLEGGCSAHHRDGSERTACLIQAIRSGEMPRTLAIDDFAAVLFESGRPRVNYSWVPGAAARYLVRAGDVVREEPVEGARKVLAGP